MEKVKTEKVFKKGEIERLCRKITEDLERSVLERFDQIPELIISFFKTNNPQLLTTIFMMCMFRARETIESNISEKPTIYDNINLEYKIEYENISFLRINISFSQKIEIQKNMEVFFKAFSNLTTLFPKLFNYLDHCTTSNYINYKEKREKTLEIKLFYGNSTINIPNIIVGFLKVHIKQEENKYTVEFKFEFNNDDEIECFNLEVVKYIKKIFNGLKLTVEIITENKNIKF